MRRLIVAFLELVARLLDPFFSSRPYMCDACALCEVRGVCSNPCSCSRSVNQFGDSGYPVQEVPDDLWAAGRGGGNAAGIQKDGDMGWKTKDLEAAWERSIAKYGAPIRDEVTNCLRWQGAHFRSGYGILGGADSAHRYAYIREFGPIEQGLTIDHVYERGCRYRDCVNPEHLEAVTLSENGRRAALHRHPTRGNANCPNGHEYTAENTHTSSGIRHCRTCTRNRVAKWRAARAGAASAESSSGSTTVDDPQDQPFLGYSSAAQQFLDIDGPDRVCGYCFGPVSACAHGPRELFVAENETYARIQDEFSASQEKRTK